AVNATIFSLVRAFLLRRPPVHEARRVVAVSSINPNRVFLPDAYPVSAPNYLTWCKGNHVFSQMAAVDPFRTVSLTEQGQAEALLSGAVTPNYFSVLGVAPQLGRTFSEGEDQPGREHVVILSHDLWERRFGSDPASRLALNSRLWPAAPRKISRKLKKAGALWCARCRISWFTISAFATAWQ